MKAFFIMTIPGFLQLVVLLSLSYVGSAVSAPEVKLERATEQAVREQKHKAGHGGNSRPNLIEIAGRLSLRHIALSAAAPQSNEERATEMETQEVEKVATAFMKRLQETRDLASLKDLYVDDFIKRKIEFDKVKRSSLDPLHNYFGSGFSVNPALLTQGNHHDWRRLYVASVNLKYFLVLSIASGPNAPKDLEIKKVFPPKVLALFEASPAYGKHEIGTLEELRSVINILERASAMMRELFLRNPPEQMPEYKKNMQSWHSSDQEPRIMRLSVEVATEEQFGFPKGTRFFKVLTKPWFFEIRLVKTNAGMKILSARVYPFN